MSVLLSATFEGDNVTVERYGMQGDGAQAGVGWIVDEQGAGRRAGSDL